MSEAYSASKVCLLLREAFTLTYSDQFGNSALNFKNSLIWFFAQFFWQILNHLQQFSSISRTLDIVRTTQVHFSYPGNILTALALFFWLLSDIYSYFKISCMKFLL